MLPRSHAGNDLRHCSRPKDLLRVLPPAAGLGDGVSALQPGDSRDCCANSADDTAGGDSTSLA